HHLDNQQVGAFLDGHAQEKWPDASQPQLEPRQEAGVLVVQPLLAGPPASDVAEAVEHPKGIAALDDFGTLLGPRCSRRHVPLLANEDLLAHGHAFCETLWFRGGASGIASPMSVR